MSYLVLARKWRPSTFEEVVGQAHVTRTLANAIESGRVGHAYLFSGPRGVGKTTTARLLAKALNCPNAKGAVPCNACDVCREITIGVSLDVIEIDGASNRGIDEIRNLRENVKYAPTGGKYKVYVVDEVHMLTDAAFNALLKTLEEPPPHVKFILATTAPLKVPETILSRCQRFEFVRIPTRDVSARLKDICSAEGFKVKDDVLILLSRRANGSLRDAESMLDQLISAGLEEAPELDVAQLLGLSGAESFFSVIDAVKAKDARKALEALGALFDKGANLDEFADGLMEHLRNLLLIKIHPNLASLVEASTGHVKRYEEQAKQFSEGDILRLINIASRASFYVRRGAMPRLHLEMAIVEMAYLDSTTQLSELIDRLERLEVSLSGRSDAPGQVDGPGRAAMRPGRSEASATPAGEAEGTTGKTTPPAQAEEPGRTIARAAAPSAEAEEPAPAIAEPTETVSTGESARAIPRSPVEDPQARGEGVTPESLEKWNLVLARITSRKKSLGVCLSVARFLGISQGRVLLGFREDKSFEQSIVEQKVNKKVFQEECTEVFKATLRVSCVKIEPDSEETPEEVSAAESGNNNAESNAGGSLKTIIEYFDGEIIEE
ncbi:MAG: DNA polymerase III subunit gamma/tau [Candidatus Eisenbacteria bacterium]|nr:DNA polymerase III subunit gamma/tau [Candidatus Eisenbacteria bacterium]